jgi:DNA-binding winged helix-turn-helix (wHTH) protein
VLKSPPSSPEPLQEWERRFIPDAQLTVADQELRDQLAEGEDEARLVVEELKGGLRVQASSWIGVVRFSAAI